MCSEFQSQEAPSKVDREGEVERAYCRTSHTTARLLLFLEGNLALVGGLCSICAHIEAQRDGATNFRRAL